MRPTGWIDVTKSPLCRIPVLSNAALHVPWPSFTLISPALSREWAFQKMLELKLLLGPQDSSWKFLIWGYQRTVKAVCGFSKSAYGFATSVVKLRPVRGPITSETVERQKVSQYRQLFDTALFTLSGAERSPALRPNGPGLSWMQ